MFLGMYRCSASGIVLSRNSDAGTHSKTFRVAASMLNQMWLRKLGTELKILLLLKRAMI